MVTASSNAQKLKYIAKLVAECTLCPLYKTAQNPVPGNGNPNTQLVFIGEAPGFYDDQQGLPFVGNSGKLLDKLLADIGLNREQVFICNILKHRPPDNRDPLPNEIRACVPYLKAQLQVIKPKIIVTLGRFALNYFLPDDMISRVHGEFRNIDWQGISLTLIPVYHPSAALRSTANLEALKEDFRKIGQYLNS